jgi:hypothetical protein
MWTPIKTEKIISNAFWMEFNERSLFTKKSGRWDLSAKKMKLFNPEVLRTIFERLIVSNKWGSLSDLYQYKNAENVNFLP